MPYTQLRTGKRKTRDFDIHRYILTAPRELLFDRINRRVDMMMANGALEEAERLYPKRHLNSLNTVGPKELFAYMDGEMDLPTAIARLQKNTRVYAKKQIRWFARNEDSTFLDITDHGLTDRIISKYL
jgi:tRNA dimethylallyltransferase